MTSKQLTFDGTDGTDGTKSTRFDERCQAGRINCSGGEGNFECAQGDSNTRPFDS
jgi:hypothetical protein